MEGEGKGKERARGKRRERVGKREENQVEKWKLLSTLYAPDFF